MKLLIFMLALGAGLISFSCTRNNKESMKNMLPDKDKAVEFSCPMHPEIKGHEGDKCPKCGMNLEKATPKKEVSMSFETSPSLIEAGKPVHLVFTPKDKADASRAVELEETHEKKIHVIAVSEDLSWFDHIHAESSHNGSFKVTETFPHGGLYFVYADYKRKGGDHQTDKFEVVVKGDKLQVVDHHPKITSLTDGYTVSVKKADRPKTGRLEVPILVEKHNEKLKRSDFENYLGAVAHIILVSQEEKEFMHIHPESTEEYPIQGHAEISKPGIYRMWVQFQTNGIVHTADFTLNIKEGTGVVQDEHAQDEHDQHGDHKH